MNACALLKKQSAGNSEAFAIIYEHSRLVADKALNIARRVGNSRLDLPFIEEGALLHDIGVFATRSPKLSCHGSAPYICHGILGRDILENEGFPRHALVCERHIGVGLTIDDIREQNLPLPARDMSPLSTEERIICFADLFFSKRPGQLANEKTVDQVRNNLAGFGQLKVETFNSWLLEFS